MKKTIENVIKKCEICDRINRKTKGGCYFIETTRHLEKVALDLMNLEGTEKYILLAIYYYTSHVLGEIIDNKRSETILNIINKWCVDSKPEELITDNGKEFMNSNFEVYCKNNNIQHRKVSIEAHRSNGRIVRLLRTIREGLMKKDGNDIYQKLDKVIDDYNNTYHKAIQRTPLEAILDTNSELILANSRYGQYAKSFKRSKRELFNMNQKVIIAKRENLDIKDKATCRRFLEDGEIVGIFDNNSYLF